MKKIMICILAGLMIASLVGCSSTNKQQNDIDTNQADELVLPDEQDAMEEPAAQSPLPDGSEQPGGEDGQQPDGKDDGKPDDDDTQGPDLLDEVFAIELAYDILEENDIKITDEEYGENPTVEFRHFDDKYTYVVYFKPTMEGSDLKSYVVEIDAESGEIIHWGEQETIPQDVSEPQADTADDIADDTSEEPEETDE